MELPDASTAPSKIVRKVGFKISPKESQEPKQSMFPFGLFGMERVLARLSGLVVNKAARDDDKVDRLHHSASLILLLVFASGTALQEYVGQPINCWTPSKYPQEHYTQHVNGYCWTHPLRYPEASTSGGTTGLTYAELLEQRRIVNFGTAFYRWVTIIFILQAVLFKLPSVIWGYLNRQSGASLQKMRDLLLQSQLAEADQRGAKLDEAADYLHAWLAAYRMPTSRSVFGRNIGKLGLLFTCAGRRSGKYLCVVYIGVKILYLVNLIGNFVLLAVFLDADFWRYGITVLNDILVKGDWHDPINFPRLLLCDFYLYESEDNKATTGNTPGVTTTDSSANSHMTVAKVQTLQCVLSINIMLEKLFVLTWFWLVLLLLLTLATCVTWSLATLCTCAPFLFARKFMKTLPRSLDELEAKSRERFVTNYLRQDGIFILRMLESNTDNMIVRELVVHLWDNYRTTDTSSVEMADEVDTMMKEDAM